MSEKKVLLVDDDETFLFSLKNALGLVDDVFHTDICYSVNEAIKNIALKQYDMIITDIRMPEKSGIELLIYLKDIAFPGKVMVMTAYNLEENSENIKSLGIIDVISKPINVEWFKNMLLDWFVEEKERAVTFESVDLKTVLQIINLEKKNSVLQIERNDKKGMIYFANGEIIHADFDNLKGEEALLKLVMLKNSIISVIKGTQKVKPTIVTPFFELIVKITDRIDNSGNSSISSQNKGKVNRFNGDRIKKILAPFTGVKGYLGSGIFTPEATHLEKNPETPNIPIENIASLINLPLEEAHKLTKEASIGIVEMVQIYTKNMIIIAATPSKVKYNFHILLVLTHDGNVAMAMMKLRKAVKILKSIL